MTKCLFYAGLFSGRTAEFLHHSILGLEMAGSGVGKSTFFLSFFQLLSQHFSFLTLTNQHRITRTTTLIRSRDSYSFFLLSISCSGVVCDNSWMIHLLVAPGNVLRKYCVVCDRVVLYVERVVFCATKVVWCATV